jgi:hypothetical protein
MNHPSACSKVAYKIMQIPAKVIEFPGIVYIKTKTREQKFPDT